MIHSHNLHKSFGGRTVLNGLDLTVDPGRVTLLVGANGAGKTTALRLFAGLSPYGIGAVSICQHDLAAERRAALACLSYLPQAPRFHPRLTVRHVAEFHAELRGQHRENVAAALESWGMLQYSSMPTSQLSGGLRQRLALAVFALADTPVLILDEPGLSLDPEWRLRLQEFLSRQAQCGRTVLVATHLLGEWEGSAGRCILIEHGRSAGDLPPDRLRSCFPRIRVAPMIGSAEYAGV